MSRMLFVFVFLLLSPGIVSGQSVPPIGTIDYYGLHKVPKTEIERALQIEPGAKPSKSLHTAKRRLEAVPGVARARLTFVCCDPAGRTILYVGIQEVGAPVLRFRTAPSGDVRLPPEIVTAGRDLENALFKAVESGDSGEDDSRGYMWSHNPGMRAVEERFLGFAAHDFALLRNVLRNSSDASQRALATEVLGYSKDHRAVVPDLEYAMSDPNSGVRNNAMRALAVVAEYSDAHPSADVIIPTHPFIKMLNSLSWTDRNKAGFALMELTAQRDPAVLADLRREALPELVEMARWKTPGHAEIFCVLLGRIASIPDKQISSDFQHGEKEKIIAAALKSQSPERQRR